MHNAHAYENLTQDNSNGDLENKIVCDKLFREFIKSKTLFVSMKINFIINFLYLWVFGVTESHSSDPLYIYIYRERERERERGLSYTFF